MQRVYRRGDRFVYVMATGKEEYRACAGGCLKSGRWTSDDPKAATCPRCSGPLGDPVLRRRQRWSESFATEEEAEAAYVEKLHKFHRGQDPFPASMALGDYIETWLDGQQHHVRAGTIRRYRQLLNDYFVPFIGSKQLAKLKASDVQLCINKMHEKKLAPATIVQARAAFRKAMQEAVDHELIDTNPVARVRRPRVPASPTRWRGGHPVRAARWPHHVACRAHEPEGRHLPSPRGA